MNMIKKIISYLRSRILLYRYPNCHPSVHIGMDVRVYEKKNLVMEEETNIDRGAIIMNTRAKVIFKKWSGAAVGLLAVSGNHMSVVGRNLKQVTDELKNQLDVNRELDRDIVVEEDCWIGSRVTLLSGVHIGRGGVVGSGSVVRKSTPPYAIVSGNPAKIVGFRFTPSEVIEHEKALYEENMRLPLDVLEKNYNKYFISRIKEIKVFSKL